MRALGTDHCSLLPVDPYLAPFLHTFKAVSRPFFPRNFPSFARFHRLAKAVPTSPKPDPRAKKQPARPRGPPSIQALSAYETSHLGDLQMTTEPFGMTAGMSSPLCATRYRPQRCDVGTTLADDTFAAISCYTTHRQREREREERERERESRRTYDGLSALTGLPRSIQRTPPSPK